MLSAIFLSTMITCETEPETLPAGTHRLRHQSSRLRLQLHEDAIHRGPAQTIPAVRNGIKGAMLRGRTVIMEPMQKAFVSVPNDWLGQVTREVTNRRGIIEDMPSEGEVTTVVGTPRRVASFLRCVSTDWCPR